MKNFVIDASVASKWIFREKGSDIAEHLVDKLFYFFAPDLFLIEMDSIISKKVRMGEISIKKGLLKNKQVRKLPYRLLDYKSISHLSFNLATSLPVTIYDATYVATAIERNAVLYTTDQKLANGLKNTMFNSYVKSIWNTS